MILQLKIPDHLRFADLKLERDPTTGEISFDLDPIEQICLASDIPIETFSAGPEDNVGELINAWYRAARQKGEPADPVQEQLIAEALAEEEYGVLGVQEGTGRLQ